jgi:hypothetical protein
MKRVALLAALLMVGFAVQAEPVSAQDASYARWDGTMTPPGGETVDISYLVRFNARVKQGTIIVPATGEEAEQEYKMIEIKVHDDMLMYKWEIEHYELSCELNKDDLGVYSGDCTDQYGEKGQMSMDASAASKEMMRGEGDPADNPCAANPCAADDDTR